MITINKDYPLGTFPYDSYIATLETLSSIKSRIKLIKRFNFVVCVNSIHHRTTKLIELGIYETVCLQLIKRKSIENCMYMIGSTNDIVYKKVINECIFKELTKF